MWLQMLPASQTTLPSPGAVMGARVIYSANPRLAWSRAGKLCRIILGTSSAVVAVGYCGEVGRSLWAL